MEKYGAKILSPTCLIQLKCASSPFPEGADVLTFPSLSICKELVLIRYQLANGLVILRDIFINNRSSLTGANACTVSVWKLDNRFSCPPTMLYVVTAP